MIVGHIFVAAFFLGWLYKFKWWWWWWVLRERYGRGFLETTNFLSAFDEVYTPVFLVSPGRICITPLPPIDSPTLGFSL